MTYLRRIRSLAASRISAFKLVSISFQVSTQDTYSTKVVLSKINININNYMKSSIVKKMSVLFLTVFCLYM